MEDYGEKKMFLGFYKESLYVFKTCKMIIGFSRISTDEFPSLPIWNNKLFTYKTGRFSLKTE